MPEKANLCQKSRGPVTQITRLYPVNCDGYHDSPCGSALLEGNSVTRMGNMPSGSHLSDASRHVARGEAPVSPTSESAGVRQRPLQVTWEMTRACGWKAAPPRTPKVAPRDSHQFST